MNQSSFNGSSRVVAPGTIIADQTLSVMAIVIGFAGNAKVCYFFVQRRDLRKVPHFCSSVWQLVESFHLLSVYPLA